MKNLILLATFFVFNFFSITQKAPSTKNDVEFRVYKKYDKKGNLIRYDSTRVEKGHRLHNSFQFKFLSDSLPIHNLRMDSLLSHKRAFLFKDRDLLDSLKGHKMVPNISIFRKDSVMEIPNHFLHFKRDLQEKNLDSILNQHFNRMEKLFEQFFEQNDQAKRKRSTR